MDLILIILKYSASGAGKNYIKQLGAVKGEF